MADSKDQTTGNVETLLKAPKKSLGIYVAPEFQYGSLAGQFTPMGGGSVMVVLNRKLSIGASGYSTFRNFTPSQISATNSLQLNAHVAGARIEYTLNPNKVVHISFPLLIGGGRGRIDSAGRESHGRGFISGNSNQFTGNGNHRNDVSFVLIQPGVNVEVNLFRYVKVFGGASYRIVSGGHSHPSDVPSIDPPYLGQLQGLSFNVGIKVGYDFRMHRK